MTSLGLRPSRLSTVLLAATTALAFGVAFSELGFTGDTFFYLAAGDYVLDHGALPSGDPFAFASMPGPWLLHFPLCQLGFAALERAFGLDGLHLFGALLATLALLALGWRRTASPLAQAAALVPLGFGAFLDEELFSLRGQLVAMLYFAALLPIVARLLRGETVPLVVPVLLSTLWVNTHPSFVLLFALPAVGLAASQLDDPEERPPLAPFTRFFALALLGLGITPYGFALAVDDLRLFEHASLELLTHFQGPDLRDPWWLTFVAGSLILAAARHAAGPPARRASETAVLLVLLLATLYARRYVLFLAAYEVGIVAALVQSRTVAPRTVGAVVGAVTVGFVLLSALALRRPADPLRTEPVAAAEVLGQLEVGRNLGNLWGWGGYLMWRYRGQPQVFVDGRANLFASSVVHDYARIKYAAEGYDALLEMYAIDVLLWRPSDPIATALAQHPGWREVYRDEVAVIFQRRP